VSGTQPGGSRHLSADAIQDLKHPRWVTAGRILPTRRWRLPSRDSADLAMESAPAAVVALEEAIT